MADSPPPFSIDSVLEAIKKTTESIAGFVRTVAGWIREKDWVNLICLILAIIILGWLSRAAIAKFLGEQNSQWFLWICLAVGIFFIVAVVVAVFAQPSLSDTATSPVERQAIKGLLSFTQTDAEIFSQLERNQDIKGCLRTLNDTNFRLGILWGESGCGKTSFLLAGIIPELTKLNKDKGIYVQFSDKDPIITVKKALNKDLKLNLSNAEIEQLGLIAVFKKSIEAAQKPLVLFFDQFEQFFVHYQSTEARRPFIDALNSWYRNEEIAVKILMSFRSDLLYQQYEIQQVLDYSLDSKNNIKLKKFSVEQATNILAVIAKTENIEFDRKDIQSFVEQELVDRGKDKSDEPISPVDIQILSLVIGDQKNTEVRKFDKTALNKIGRFEGLLYQYLEERLSFREQSATSAQKEAVIKLLLELIDTNELTRAGAFTLAQLEEKLGAIGSKQIQDTVRWLENERLIVPLQQEDETVYQLAHERMIPAVLKLSGKILPKADKANELLNKQVKIWIDSNYNPRYLLGLRELWLIEQQQSYLMWGDRQQQKERLIRKSKQQIYRNFGILGSIVVLVMGIWGWLNHTASGQLTQVRWKFDQVSQQIRDPSYQVQAVTAFAKDENFSQASKLTDQITESNYKASALSAIAKAYGTLNQPEQVIPLVQQALTSAKDISNNSNTDASYKADVLRAIAEAISKLKWEKAAPLLKEASTFAQGISDSDKSDPANAFASYKAEALSAIVVAYSKLNQPHEADKRLEQTLISTNEISDLSDRLDTLYNIGKHIGELNPSNQTIELLKTVTKSTNNINAEYPFWIAIAQAYNKINQSQSASDSLQKALVSVENIPEEIPPSASNSSDSESAFSNKSSRSESAFSNKSSRKDRPLQEIAKAIGTLDEPNAPLLKNALRNIDNIKDYELKAKALSAIVQAQSKLNQPQNHEATSLLEKALVSANKIKDSASRSSALTAIAETYNKLEPKTEMAASLLEKAFVSANEIKDDPESRSSALTAIAEAYNKLESKTEMAASLLEKALVSADEITESQFKADALIAIAKAISKLNPPEKATSLLEKAIASADKIEYSSYKADAVIAIAEAEANLQNWGQALKVVQQCPSEDCKVESLAQVLTIHAEKKHPEFKENDETQNPYPPNHP